MILRCQWIHQRILKKSASSIMGADSEGDEGLSLSEDSEDSEEGKDDDEANRDLLGDGGGVAVAGGLMADEQAVVEELAGGIGGHSRNTTPTNFVDADEINR
jgi:tellurite resistance protein